MEQYYIATFWFLSATAEAVDGYAGITRRVIRAKAENPIQFRQKIEFPFLDRYVDNQVWVGPISVSKKQ